MQELVVGVQVIAFSEAHMGKVKELIGLPDLLISSGADLLAGEAPKRTVIAVRVPIP